MTRTIIAGTLAVLTIYPAILPASAAPSRYVVVTYGDLDLGTRTGRTELNSRVRAAGVNRCSRVLERRVDSSRVSASTKDYLMRASDVADRAMRRIDAARL